MATHGIIVAFSSSQETWTVYVEHLEQYFAAIKIEDADQQKAILLSVCGPPTYRFICNLVSPKKPTELKIADLIAVVQHSCPVLPCTILCHACTAIVGIMIIHVSTLEYHTSLDALPIRVSMDALCDPCINLGSPYHHSIRG